MGFIKKLNSNIKKTGSLLCIGLDPVRGRMPAGVSVSEFLQNIISATSDIACCYKPNIAFFEAMGEQGIQILKEVMEAVPKSTPLIIDAKRGDIGSTAEAYVSAVFDDLRADAVTINPYMGYDSCEPFIKHKDKGVIILCRTSNPGSGDFQELFVEYGGSKIPLYEVVAKKASEWNKYGNIGLVIGATYPLEIAKIRKQHPKMLFLVPGTGTQGGIIKEAIENGVDLEGKGIIINSSRQILYASQGADYAEKAREAALSLKEEINKYRKG